MPEAITRGAVDAQFTAPRAQRAGHDQKDQSYAKVASEVEAEAAGGESLPPKAQSAAADAGATSSAVDDANAAPTDDPGADEAVVSEAVLAEAGAGETEVSEAGGEFQVVTDKLTVEALNVVGVEGELPVDGELPEGAGLAVGVAVQAEATDPLGGQALAATGVGETQALAATGVGETQALAATRAGETQAANASLNGKLNGFANPAMNGIGNRATLVTDPSADEASLTSTLASVQVAKPGQPGISLGLDPRAVGLDGLLPVNARASQFEAMMESLTGSRSTSDASPLQQPGLQQAGTQQAARLMAPPAVEFSVPQRVGEAGWHEGMAGRLSMLVNQNLSMARIQLNPAELGPIEVKVNLNHDQASVQFVSHSAAVRDALEQTVPRLREMLEASGFSLVDSQVSDQSNGGQGSRDSEQGNAQMLAEAEILAPVQTQSLGLIDYYA